MNIEIKTITKQSATPRDVERILDIEASGFTSDNLDPAETPAGINTLLALGGEINLLGEDRAIFERIPLENLLTVENWHKVEPHSPLRQIGERTDVLERAATAYSSLDKPVLYIHGVVARIQHRGDGSRLTSHAFGLADESVRQEASNRRIHFGYVDIGPTTGDINMASFGLFFKHECRVDGFEAEVYEPGVPYLRISHGTGYQLVPDDPRAIDLNSPGYLTEIKSVLDDGYLGMNLTLNPPQMHFQKRA